MAGEQVEVVDLHRRVVGDEFFPSRFAGVLHWGSGDAVVLGFIIGADVELAAPVGDEVFVVWLARLHQAQRRVGPRRAGAWPVMCGLARAAAPGAAARRAGPPAETGLRC